MKKVTFILACLISVLAIAQNKNINLLGQIDYSTLLPPRGDLSDIWGYVDGSGNEYAIVGNQNGVSIVDVTNPTNPTEVFYTPGATTIWRDIKTWGTKAYVTNEGGNGLMIIDLASLPNTSGITVTNFTGSTYSFSTAHNLYIDENGIAYIFGANNGVGGAIMLDVKTDPPTELGRYNDYYLHDGVVRGDTLWGAAINDGFLVVVDVSNKANPVQFPGAIQNTPDFFTHNVWFSDNNQYVFTTDEVSSGKVTAYDVSNLSNIIEVDRVQSNPGSGVIVHNTHFMNDYVITSWYRDGVVIHDVSDPSNMIEVGNYDTSPLSGNNFNGCWGVYPWLPSGNIIASDIEEGLFVLGPTYTRGCYLEGTVTDANTTLPLSSVNVNIISQNAPTTTDVNGFYKTGIADAGTYNVAYSKSGYFPDTAYNVVLTNGIITTQNMQLVPMTPFPFTGQVVETSTGNPIPNANVNITNSSFNFNATTDATGTFTINNFYSGTYEVTAGKWGYVTTCLSGQNLTTTTTGYQIQLDSGYYDDFSFDFGWVENSTASAGIWERGEPIGTDYNGTPAQPDNDVTNDCKDLCYVTGNAGGSVGNDDVDNGYTYLTSPVFDLSTYIDPYVSYSRWFFNDGGFGSPNDSLVIYINNGTSSVRIDGIDANSPATSTWINKNIRILDYTTLSNNMTLEVKTADNTPGHLVEAAFDRFKIIENGAVSVSEIAEQLNISIYPNPFMEEFTINTSDLNGKVNVVVIDIAGREVLNNTYKSGFITISPNWEQGIYLVKIYNNDNLIATEKVIKN